MVAKINKTKKKITSKSKLDILEEVYGKDTGSNSLKETSEFLKKAGYKSLADLLYPAK